MLARKRQNYNLNFNLVLIPMKLSIPKKIGFTLLFVAVLMSSCTEQYAFQNQIFEEALIVEATITNEMTHQEVKLSRASAVNDGLPLMEFGAVVTVVNNSGTEFNFEEKGDKYISETKFKAEPNSYYQLKIRTVSGKEYISSTEQVTAENTINVETAVIEKEGEKGVQINVKNYDPTNSSKFYRYEYEETYQIKTNFEVKEQLKESGYIAYNNYFKLDILPAKSNTRICYSTNYSSEILQTNTVDQQKALVNYAIRFISQNDYILTNRYTIKVKQYTQNRAAYDYYYTLNKMSGTGDLLSPNQPGYIVGNIKSTTNASEKVVGFFEVASVSQKRIFFNYEDIFPSQKLTDYFRECEPILVEHENLSKNNFSILRSHVYLGPGAGLNVTKYYMVEKECGDCTTFSSNVKPSFWID